MRGIFLQSFLRIINAVIHFGSRSDKTGILDVKLRLKDGTTIDIEIQNSWSAEFIPRTLFYWAKIYVEGFKEGEAYTSLTKCIAINLVSQGFKLNNLVHSVYRILEKKSYQQLTDLLEIHFLNLLLASQVTMQQEPIGNQEKLINWLQFIRIHSFENSGTGYKEQAKIKRRRTCCTSSIYFCAATP